MDQMEYGSELDAVEAAGLPGAGCCAHSSEDAARSLFSQLNFDEKWRLVRMLEQMVGQKEKYVETRKST